jgi:ferredoxin-2, mitochondrial
MVISFSVEDRDGKVREIEAPDDMNLSLMEVLKASEYDVLATCGGMALCATCHVEVMSGLEKLDNAKDVELDMIDTLPNAKPESRLACQIRITGQLSGAHFKLMESCE